MTLVLDAVLPVFLLALLGYFLFRIRFINAEMAYGLNQLVYWVGLPCLLFHKIAHQDLDWTSVGDVLAAFFAALSVTILLAYGVASLLKVDSKSTGAFVQAAYRGNLGFIGLPIILYSVTEATMQRTSAISALALAPCAIAFNVIAVILMIVHQPPSEHRRPKFLVAFLSNPLIVGGLLGVGAAMFQWNIPVALDRSIEGLSNMSVPVALIGLGASFGVYGIQGINRDFVLIAASATLLKVFVSPLLGIIISLVLRLDPTEARIVCVYLATPTAIASNVIVGQFRGDEKLAASAIVTATLTSICFLPMVLWLTREETWAQLSSWF